jgi:hypothetical protein
MDVTSCTKVLADVAQSSKSELNRRISRECFSKPDASFLLLLVYQMLMLGHNVAVIVKRYYMDRKNVENHFILEELAKIGVVYDVDDRTDVGY